MEISFHDVIRQENWSGLCSQYAVVHAAQIPSQPATVRTKKVLWGHEMLFTTPSLQRARGTAACKSFTACTGGGPLLIMCGRVALDRAAPLLWPACLNQSGAGLPRSLVATPLRRGVTEPLGREGNRYIADRPKLEFSPSSQCAIVPRLLGLRPWVPELFRYRLPAATHDQRIGRSPRFGRIGPALKLS
jgi:hypothetical protein